MSRTPSQAEVWVELLPTSAGGRQSPVDFNTGIYRPHLRVGHGDMLGVKFVAGPAKAVAPGEAANATALFVFEPGVSYDDLAEGATFEIIEGVRVVGRGRVVKVQRPAQQS